MVTIIIVLIRIALVMVTSYAVLDFYADIHAPEKDLNRDILAISSMITMLYTFQFYWKI